MSVIEGAADICCITDELFIPDYSEQTDLFVVIRLIYNSLDSMIH